MSQSEFGLFVFGPHIAVAWRQHLHHNAPLVNRNISLFFKPALVDKSPMAYRLLNRNMQIPGGLFFYQPQTKWKSAPGSFMSVVGQIIAHRQANPWLNLPTDMASVEDELDLFAAQICAQMNWTNYISSPQGAVPPLPMPPHLPSRASGLVAGAEPIVDWIASGAEAVPKEVSERRAKVCSECPQNQRGDWLRFFTVAASEAIRKALNLRSEMKLETSFDAVLGVCAACDCPLRLKMHMPIERIRSKLKPDAVARLDPSCWIPKE